MNEREGYSGGLRMKMTAGKGPKIAKTLRRSWLEETTIGPGTTIMSRYDHKIETSLEGIEHLSKEKI